MIAEHESQFNQFKKDGKTPYSRCPTPGNPDTDAVGIMQLKRSIWLDKSNELGPKYDFVNSVLGNLRMAVWIFERQGFEPWGGNPITKFHLPWFDEDVPKKITEQRSNIEKTPSPYEIQAPTDSWSEKIISIPNYSLRITFSGNVWCSDDGGEPYKDGPDIELGDRPKKYLQCRSRTGKPESIFVEPFK